MPPWTLIGWAAVTSCVDSYVPPPFHRYGACAVNRFYSLSIHQRFLISSCFLCFGCWGSEAKLSYLVFIFHGHFGSTLSCDSEAWGEGRWWAGQGTSDLGSWLPTPLCLAVGGVEWDCTRWGLVMLCLSPSCVLDGRPLLHPPTHPSIHPYDPPDCLNQQSCIWAHLPAPNLFFFFCYKLLSVDSFSYLLLLNLLNIPKMFLIYFICFVGHNPLKRTHSSLSYLTVTSSCLLHLMSSSPFRKCFCAHHQSSFSHQS